MPPLNTSGSVNVFRLLIFTLLFGVLQISSFLSIQAKALPAGRLYVIGGGRVEVFDAATLAPLPSSGAAHRLHGATQFVPSPDGSKLGIIRSDGRAGSRATLTIIRVRANAIVRTDSVSGLSLLGVSNDGQGWYGEQTSASGRVVQFVSSHQAVRHTLVFHLPQPCCLLLQYDPRRDRLYALPLQTAWGRNPNSPVLTAWQVASRHRLGSLRTPLELIAGTWFTGPSPGTTFAPQMHRIIPGFALSRDGRRIAILDFADNRLDTIDPLRVRVLGNPFIRGSTFESTSGRSPVPSPLLSGVSDGFAITAQFSPDGRTLYQQGFANLDLKCCGVTPESLLVQSIDVAQKRVRGVISTSFTAPVTVGTDGRSVYTVTTSNRGGKQISLVQRRNATNLVIAAQRSIVPFARQYALLDLSG
jgi:hypothetical protein